MAARYRNVTRRRSSSVKVAVPLTTCNARVLVGNNDTDGLKSGRQVAARYRNVTRRRSSSVKVAVPLEHAMLDFLVDNSDTDGLESG